ncbi:hypothetical protein JW868_01985 [Candidatus Woesearchaeota archaeon]|nr:hypothetical protein [Candidatus Woesearchaeota archaeon]
MKRKLVKQGAATLMVSLPSFWVKKNGLAKGSVVDIEEQQTALTISTDNGTNGTKKEITIEISDENRHDTSNMLTHLYRRGFDTIMLKGIDDQTLHEVRTAAAELLLGFEITETTKGYCRIENISEPTGEKFDVLLRRCFLVIKETQSLLNEDYKKSEFNHLDSVKELRNQQDKLLLFCRRVISKNPSNMKESVLEWELITFIMHIEHAYYYLYKYCSENKAGFSKEIFGLLHGLEEYFQLFYDAYFQKDIKKIHKINQKKEIYHFGKCLEVMHSSTAHDGVIAAKVREIFRWIQVGSSPILGILFQEKLH